MELPLLMSYLREGDKIVRREEKRTSGMTYGPNKIKEVTSCGAHVYLSSGSVVFVVDYQMNQCHRLYLCHETIHKGDVLVRLRDNVQGVIAGTTKHAVSLGLPIQRERILVEWPDLDSGWRMQRRLLRRRRRSGADKPV